MKCKGNHLCRSTPSYSLYLRNGPDNSMGLLIDFDNGADLSTAGIAKKELVLRTVRLTSLS